MTELSGMYAEAHHAIVTALDGFINDDPDKAREVAPIAGKLRGLEVELRNRHIQRLDKAGMRLRNGPCLCGYSRDHRAHRLSFEQRRQGHHFLLHGGAQGEGVTDTEKEAFSKKPLPAKTATGRPRGKSSAAKRLCMNTHAEPFSFFHNIL